MSIHWAKIIADRQQDFELPNLPMRIEVPRPPQCVAEFIQCVDRPATPLSELGGIIEKDTEIASSVLRIVNGSQLMLKGKISSVSRAIGMLGVQRCKMLVMSAAIQSSMSGGHASTQQASEFLIEAQVRSLYARRVAEILNVDVDISYIAALLQDLVLPQLLKCEHEYYEAFQKKQERLVEFERSVLSCDHSLYTATLLSKWNFAEEVIACVAMHHETETILEDPQLLYSEVAAVAISSLLPGVLNQEPDGIQRLMEFQKRIPEFDFLQVATDVDEEIKASFGGGKSRVPLSDRLSRLAMASLNNDHSELNWVERNVGSYTLEEKLGQGGMGVVYRARHSMLRRPAAVKMLKTSTLSAQILEQFEVEAHITSELSSPHTVQVYDYGMTSEGELYYVMEFLQGMNLVDIVRNHGPLPEERIIHILCQVCGSLAEAHSKGLIHRDIKPDNIALTVCAGAYDFVKVLDFGLVAVKDRIPELASTNKLYGTPAYMAPEAIQAPDLLDESTDIYALGAVAYFCLTGKPLFHGLTLTDILRAQIDQIPEVPVENCSLQFAELIMSCLEKNKQSRPQTVMEIVQALGNCPNANSWSFKKALDWWENKSMTESSIPDDQDDQATVPGGITVDEATRLIVFHGFVPIA
ncbi:HDOD domain-containing protein [Planctomicrobium sp.]|nr:HDOD domain-containing protein [Planctomicrobium sp.]MDB4733547.1 HDOD domain-containing protein [Planctomicrobium sp.]